MIFMYLILAGIYASFGSAWIDSLYLRYPDILSYPAALEKRARFRHKLLFAGMLGFLPMMEKDAAVTIVLFHLILTGFLLMTILTDFEQYVIFDRMLLPCAVLSLPFLLLLPVSITDHLVAAVGGGLLFLLLAILTRGGIGGGDIKLIFVLGLWLGKSLLIPIVLGGLIFGGAAALLMLLLGKKKRKEFFAYGPYFSIIALGLIYLHN